MNKMFQLKVPSITLAILLLIGQSYIQADGAGCSSCNCANNKLYKVLILGGGMSGIAAARALRDNGIEDTDFLILEGHSKIGGRLRKMEFANGTIELGANWIQGDCSNITGVQVCNPISEIAKGKTMLTCSLDNEEANRAGIIMYDHNGEMYTSPNTSNYPFVDLRNYSETLRKMMMNDVSVESALNNLQSSWNNIPDSPKKQFVEWYNHDSCFAAPPNETSLSQTHPLPTYRDFGDRIRLVNDSRGYAKILDCILQGHENVTRLNTTVTKIRNYKNNSTCVCVDTVQTGYDSESVETFCGEYAIVTFSIGVLQSNHTNLFDPQLPEKKVLAINNFTMPLFLKIFLHFNVFDWLILTHKDGSNKTDTNNYIGYASELRGEYPLFVPLPNNVIMAVVTSPFSDKIKLQNDSTIEQSIMTILRRIYGNDIPDPDQMYIHHWETDPLFLGTYSNTPVGVTRSTHENLAEKEGQLYFAGEAASADYSGFVHGAYFAGIDSGSLVAIALASSGGGTGAGTTGCPRSSTGKSCADGDRDGGTPEGDVGGSTSGGADLPEWVIPVVATFGVVIVILFVITIILCCILCCILYCHCRSKRKAHNVTNPE